MHPKSLTKEEMRHKLYLVYPTVTDAGARHECWAKGADCDSISLQVKL